MASQTAQGSLRDDIAAANKRLAAALQQRDAAGMAACYTTDAQVLPSNSEPIEGRAAIEKFWGNVIEAGITGAKLETVEAAALGNEAYEVGKYSLTAGDQPADNGKYIVIWRREGDQWRMYRDIWNTSVPA